MVHRYTELAHAGYDVRDIIQQSIRLSDEFFVKEARGGISTSIDNTVGGNRLKQLALRTAKVLETDE